MSSDSPALVDDAQQMVKLPVQCCRCVTHAWFVFDEVGMHRIEAL